LNSNTNKYDRIVADIDHLFEIKSAVLKKQPPGTIKRIINRYSAAILVKAGLYKRFVDSGILRGWFEEFKEYWSIVLEGRPLYLHDFYFLLGIYRQRFQSVETPAFSEKKQFLDSWQNRDTLYMLFGAVRRYGYRPLHCHRFEKWIAHGDSILEYGCGVAPIAHSLLHYGKRRNLDITIADIRQINSHFARWRFGNSKQIKFLEIVPYKNTLPRDCFNVVLLVSVMEHLPDPLTTIKNVTASLKTKGILIFDYILGDGDGQDTIEAVQQRDEVLDYIKNNCNYSVELIF
jgi:2-polyprenyl-3-methyl-5-hydroxy-6-metoxy-1,4-benzoquinol methylase